MTSKSSLSTNTLSNAVDMERGTAHNATGLFCVTCAFLSYSTGGAPGLSHPSGHVAGPKHHKSIPARAITYFAYLVCGHRKTVDQHPFGVKVSGFRSEVRGKVGASARRAYDHKRSTGSDLITRGKADRSRWRTLCRRWRDVPSGARHLRSSSRCSLRC